MRFFFKSFNLKDYILFGVIMLFYVFLEIQSYPISSDDFIYRFHIEHVDDENVDRPFIADLSTLISSNTYHYVYGNGRFLVHCFVQGCLGYWGYPTFYILSALLFAIFIMSLTYLIRQGNLHPIRGDILWILLGIVLIIPLLATSFYGTVAMTINYMWSAAIYMLFLCVYFHVQNDEIHYIWWQCVILALFGLVCGSWQEAFCIGIAGTICIYHLITLRSTKKEVLWLIVGFGIGTVILLFAPGNFARVGNAFEPMPFAKTIYNLVQLLKHNPFISVWLIVVIASLIVDKVKHQSFSFVLENWFYISVAVITCLFNFYIVAKGGFQGIWQFTIIAIIDVILLMRFIFAYIPIFLDAHYKLFVTLLTIILVGFYGYIYHYRAIMHNEVTAFESSFVQERPDTIYDGHLQYVINQTIPQHPFLFNKICPMYVNWYDMKTLRRMAIFLSKGQAKWGTNILPEPVDSIISRCVDSNKISMDEIYMAPLFYVILKSDSNSQTPSSMLRLQVKPKFPIDVIKYKLKGLEHRNNDIPLNKLQSVDKNGNRYYLYRPNRWEYNGSKIINASIIDN